MEMAVDSQVAEAKEFVPYTKEIGHQGLKKLILKAGESWQTPFPGDEVEGQLSYIHIDIRFVKCFVQNSIKLS